jgi:hypothetical protein
MIPGEPQGPLVERVLTPIELEPLGVNEQQGLATQFSDPLPGAPTTAGRAGLEAEIWPIYVSEAREFEFNNSLVASWNEDLDVLL